MPIVKMATRLWGKEPVYSLSGSGCWADSERFLCALPNRISVDGASSVLLSQFLAAFVFVAYNPYLYLISSCPSLLLVLHKLTISQHRFLLSHYLFKFSEMHKFLSANYGWCHFMNFVYFPQKFKFCAMIRTSWILCFFLFWTHSILVYVNSNFFLNSFAFWINK